LSNFTAGMSELWRWIPPFLYSWAVVAHWRGLLASPDASGKGRRIAGAMAVGGHGLQIVLLSIAFGRLPFGTMWEALSLSVLVLSSSYLLLERLARSASLGVPFFLLSALGSLLVTLNEGPARLQIISQPVLFSIHVALGVSGMGLLTTSGLLAAAWLLLYRLLRSRRFGNFEREMPDLASLDRLFRAASGLGTSLLTVAAILGVFWMQGAGFHLETVEWKAGTIVLVVIWNASIPLSRRFPGYAPTRAAWLGFLGLLPLAFAVWAGVRVL